MIKYFLILFLLTGCSSIPFDIEFNRYKFQKEEKLVLGKKIAEPSSPETERFKLNLNKNPRMTWQKNF